MTDDRRNEITSVCVLQRLWLAFMSSLDNCAEVERRFVVEGAGDFKRHGSDRIEWLNIPLVFELVRIWDCDIILLDIPLVLELLKTSATRLRLIMLFLFPLATTLLSGLS